MESGLRAGGDGFDNLSPPFLGQNVNGRGFNPRHLRRPLNPRFRQGTANRSIEIHLVIQPHVAPRFGHDGANAREVVSVFAVEKVLHREHRRVPRVAGLEVALEERARDEVAIRWGLVRIHAVLSRGELDGQAQCEKGKAIGRFGIEFERGYFRQRQVIGAVLTAHVAAVQLQIETRIGPPTHVHFRAQKPRGDAIGGVDRQELGKIDFAGVARGDIGVELVPIAAEDKIKARSQAVEKHLHADARFRGEIDMAHLVRVRGQVRAFVVEFFDGGHALRPAQAEARAQSVGQGYERAEGRGPGVKRAIHI